MRERKIYVCPRCQEWFLFPKNERPDPCYRCHITPIAVSVDYGYWLSMSDKKRDEYIKRYVREHQSDIEIGANAKVTRKVFLRSRINVLVVMAMFVMFACIFSGLSSHTFLGASLGVIFGISITVCLWVFTGMAEDLQAIRQTLEFISDTLSIIQNKEKNTSDTKPE